MTNTCAASQRLNKTGSKQRQRAQKGVGRCNFLLSYCKDADLTSVRLETVAVQNIGDFAAESQVVFIKSEIYIFGFVYSVWYTTGNKKNLQFCPHLISSLVLFICLFFPCVQTCAQRHFVCLSHFFSGRLQCFIAASAWSFTAGFSAPFAEVDTMALHTGWAFINSSHCKVICMQTKLRKSNLVQEWHINLGGRAPWRCTAGAKLAWPKLAVIWRIALFKWKISIRSLWH